MRIHEGAFMNHGPLGWQLQWHRGTACCSPAPEGMDSPPAFGVALVGRRALLVKAHAVGTAKGKPEGMGRPVGEGRGHASCSTSQG